MKILLDTANVGLIRQILPNFPISGVTTNPSILAKESDDVGRTLTELKELAGERLMLHAQVTAAGANEMVEQAIKLREFIGRNF